MGGLFAPYRCASTETRHAYYAAYAAHCLGSFHVCAAPPKPQEPLLTGRRIMRCGFPHWAAETSRADYDVTQPFALIDMHKNAQRLVALNTLQHIRPGFIRP